MSEKKKVVSRKQIKPFLDEINIHLAEVRKNVENMPECSKKKSLLVTLVRLENKTIAAIKEVTEDVVMQYVNKHPEVLQKLAQFARSDEGAKEVAALVVTSEEVEAEAGDSNEQKKQAGKKRRL